MRYTEIIPSSETPYGPDAEDTDPAKTAFNAVMAMYTPDPDNIKAIVSFNRFGAIPPLHTSRTLSDRKHIAQVKQDFFAPYDPTKAEKYQHQAELSQAEMLHNYPLEAVLLGPNPN